MKAITIRQPYVQAIILGLKHYETRSWPTNYRGKIFIHAGNNQNDVKKTNLVSKYNLSNLEFGVILAECEIVDCIQITESFKNKQNKTEMDFGDWDIGRYAWKLENIKLLNPAIRINGKLGLWNF